MAKIKGTVGADALYGTTLQDLIMGLEGNDYIVAGDGDDEIKGGDGLDAIFGGNGNDVIFGGNGGDFLHGDDGDDWISGGPGDDTLLGDDGDDTLLGGSGNDILNGGAGDDIMEGGSGDDWIYGSIGSDFIIGGSGFDTLDYSNSLSAVTANLNTHVISSLAGVSRADGIESFIGSMFDDIIDGDGLANTISGGDGNDVIRGRGGADTLSGGLGVDTFVYLKKDVMLNGKHLGVDFITDFGSADKINVRDFFKGMDIEDYNTVISLTYDGKKSTLAVNDGSGFVDVVSFATQYSTSPQGLVEDKIILV